LLHSAKSPVPSFVIHDLGTVVTEVIVVVSFVMANLQILVCSARKRARRSAARV
jgi:hypothetical protein